MGGVYAWRRRLPLRHYLDIAAPSLALGQAIGRWGNFFNEEAFGTADRSAVEAVHLAAAPPAAVTRRPSSSTPPSCTSRCGTCVVFGLLVFVLRDRLVRAPGALFLAYVGLYSLGRFLTEALRTDPLMLGPSASRSS